MCGIQELYLLYIYVVNTLIGLMVHHCNFIDSINKPHSHDNDNQLNILIYIQHIYIITGIPEFLTYIHIHTLCDYADFVWIHGKLDALDMKYSWKEKHNEFRYKWDKQSLIIHIHEIDLLNKCWIADLHEQNFSRS